MPLDVQRILVIVIVVIVVVFLVVLDVAFVLVGLTDRRSPTPVGDGGRKKRARRRGATARRAPRPARGPPCPAAR
jgi:flagellar basal body-associated protein FliL